MNKEHYGLDSKVADAIIAAATEVSYRSNKVLPHDYVSICLLSLSSNLLFMIVEKPY